MKYRRNTIEEAFEARPGLIPEDHWKEFVEMQFTDKAKVKSIPQLRYSLYISHTNNYVLLCYNIESERA